MVGSEYSRDPIEEGGMPVRKLAFGVAAVVALALAATPVAAQTVTPPCAEREGYSVLDTKGKHEDVDSPLIPGIADEPDYQDYSIVEYQYRMDLSGLADNPYATKANVKVNLTWDNDGDFDLHVFDGEGNELGSSTDFVADRVETVDLFDMPQCQDLRIRIANYLAPPAADMNLDTTLSGVS